MKKNKTVHTADQLNESKKLSYLTSFPVSISLINLFREPKIEDHQFN